MAGKFDISFLLTLVDNFSTKAAAIGTSMDAMANRAKKANEKMQKLGESMMKNVSLPLLGIATFSLKSAADIEKITVSYESLTGSAETAKNVVKGLTTFAARTPFELLGIANAGKRLLAAGVPVKDLQGKLQYLGDIASGADVSLEDMASIFQKSALKGKAMSEELLQLGDRGIPVVKVLAKQLLGVDTEATQAQIFQMASKSQISFKKLETALMSMTQKGGIYFEQMKKQSKTLYGLFSTLKDSVTLAAGDVGNFISETFLLGENVEDLSLRIENLAQDFKAWVSANPELAKFIAKFLLFLAIAGPTIFVLSKFGAVLISLIKIMAFATKAIALLTSWTKIYGVVQKVVNIIMAMNPITLIVYAIIALIVYIAIAIKYWDKFGASMLTFLGPLGFIINAFMNLRKAWDDISNAFQSEGILGGLKMIGRFILDTILMPIKHVMELLSKIPGLEGLATAAKKLEFLPKAPPLFETTTAIKPLMEQSLQDLTSQTDINLKVTSDSGATVTTERVDQRKGNSNVNIQTGGFLGRTVPVGG